MTLCERRGVHEKRERDKRNTMRKKKKRTDIMRKPPIGVYGIKILLYEALSY